MSRQTDFGWRVHDALGDWTGRVDVKASIVLSLEVAVFGFVVAMARPGGPWSLPVGSASGLFGAGVGVLLIAALLAAAVVFPQLRGRQAKAEWRTNYVYFGHLRRWDPTELATTIGQVDDEVELTLIGRQLVRMSEIAWRKHIWLQWSMGAVVVAGILLALAGAHI
jgi:hypothetical protein